MKQRVEGKGGGKRKNERETGLSLENRRKWKKRENDLKTLTIDIKQTCESLYMVIPELIIHSFDDAPDVNKHVPISNEHEKSGAGVGTDVGPGVVGIGLILGSGVGTGVVGTGETLGSAVGIGLTVGFDDMLGARVGESVGSGAEHTDIDPALLPEPSSDPSLSSIDHEISFGYDPALTTTV